MFSQPGGLWAHYRRIVPELLAALSFQCNDDLHRPVMDALALLEKYRDRKITVFPLSERVPLTKRPKLLLGPLPQTLIFGKLENSRHICIPLETKGCSGFGPDGGRRRVNMTNRWLYSRA